MWRNIALAVLLSFFNTCYSSIPVILDTDIGCYSDDVGAMAILNAYADQGLINLRAVVANDRYEGIVPVIEAMNRYFNRTNIQIGVTKDPTAYSSGDNLTWSHYIVDNYPHPMYERNDEAEDAVTLYRRMLATSPDRSVLVVSIGFLTNLANLLKSRPDQYSSLDGIELVKLKVKQLISMAGKFPRGTEYNIQKQVDAARLTFQQWPTKIILAGYEASKNLQCGLGLLNDMNAGKFNNSPIRKAWLMAKEAKSLKGCFDESAAFIAVNGVEPFFSLVYGDIELFPNGTNIWHHSQQNVPTRMAYLKKVANDEDILRVLDPMLER